MALTGHTKIGTQNIRCQADRAPIPMKDPDI